MLCLISSHVYYNVVAYKQILSTAVGALPHIAVRVETLCIVQVAHLLELRSVAKVRVKVLASTHFHDTFFWFYTLLFQRFVQLKQIKQITILQ